MISLKRKFISVFNEWNIQGKLELEVLNALDGDKFMEIINRFHGKEITIVNEGLLMYLDNTEKQKLCSIIRTALAERGGRWITGDIYLKNQLSNFNIIVDDNTQKFLEDHNIENNKFESFESAEKFFNDNGLILEKKANIDLRSLSTIQYLVKCMIKKGIASPKSPRNIQETWSLRSAN
jgi:hypothetical protein